MPTKNTTGQPRSYRLMSRVRSRLPNRLQYNFTMTGLTTLAILASGLYLVCAGLWKLLWPMRKLVSKARTLKKKPPA